MSKSVEQIGPFKPLPRSFPWKATIAVALGALLASGAVLGAVHAPLGKLDFMAKVLQAKQCFIPLAVTGGALMIIGLTSIGVGQSGSRAFKQPSLYRVVRKVVHLPIDAIRTSWVEKQVVHDRTVNVQKLGTEDTLELDSAAEKFKRWNQRGKLNGSDVECCAHALLKTSQDVQYVKVRVNQSDKDQEIGLPDRESKAHVYIDLELAGSIDHIVTLHINNENHTVEYYDSTGLTINDRFGVIVRGTGGKSLPLFVKELVEKYGDGSPYEVVENTRVHQYDLHSCGVMVSHRKCGWLNATPLEVVKADSRKELVYRRTFMELICNDTEYVFQEEPEIPNYEDTAGDDF